MVRRQTTQMHPKLSSDLMTHLEKSLMTVFNDSGTFVYSDKALYSLLQMKSLAGCACQREIPVLRRRHR